MGRFRNVANSIGASQATTVTGPVHRVETRNGKTVVIRPNGTEETYDGPVTVQAGVISGGINLSR